MPLVASASLDDESRHLAIKNSVLTIHPNRRRSPSRRAVRPCLRLLSSERWTGERIGEPCATALALLRCVCASRMQLGRLYLSLKSVASVPPKHLVFGFSEVGY